MLFRMDKSLGGNVVAVGASVSMVCGIHDVAAFRKIRILRIAYVLQG